MCINFSRVTWLVLIFSIINLERRLLWMELNIGQWSEISWGANLKVCNMWFQQDDATYHTSDKILTNFRKNFSNQWTFNKRKKLIGRLSRTTLHHWMWGFRSDASNPQTSKELRVNIETKMKVSAKKNFGKWMPKKHKESFANNIFL